MGLMLMLSQSRSRFTTELPLPCNRSRVFALWLFSHEGRILQTLAFATVLKLLKVMCVAWAMCVTCTILPTVCRNECTGVFVGINNSMPIFQC